MGKKMAKKIENGLWGYKEKCLKCGKELDYYGYPFCDDCIEILKEIYGEK